MYSFQKSSLFATFISKFLKRTYVSQPSCSKRFWTAFITICRSSPSEMCSSRKVQEIYRRTPMPKCDSIKLQMQRYGCYPVNLLHIFRIPFHKNTYGGVFLNFKSNISQASDIKKIATYVKGWKKNKGRKINLYERVFLLF